MSLQRVAHRKEHNKLKKAEIDTRVREVLAYEAKMNERAEK